MRASHCDSGVSTTPKLQFCHHTLPPLSPKYPFLLTLLPPKQHPSLQNSYPFHTHKQRQRPFITSSMAATPSTTDTNTITKPFSVLFVCLGNICRSPAAEGVFTDLVKKRGLHSNFIIDSAGTIDYHEGNEADPRMRAASKRRGIQITSLSRPIRPSDFKEFDLILAMDKQNRAQKTEDYVAVTNLDGKYSSMNETAARLRLDADHATDNASRIAFVYHWVSIHIMKVRIHSEDCICMKAVQILMQSILGQRNANGISCADVADICVKALHDSTARNKSFDVCYEYLAEQGKEMYELIRCTSKIKL